MNINIGSDPDFQNILDRFADGIPATIDCDYGWAELIRKCDTVLFTQDPNYTVVQIKEKFGGLRFYFNLSNMEEYSKVNSLILAIEQDSFSVCEKCGEPGYPRKLEPSGMRYTSCDEHEIHSHISGLG